MKTIQKICTIFLLSLFVIGAGSSVLSVQTFADETSETKTTSAETEKKSTKSKNPIDVIYHQTQRRADITKFGEFSPVTSLGGLGQKILSLLLAILGGVGLLGIIAGGFIIMSSSGDDTLLDRGKTILIYSCLGVAVSLLAMGITTLVQTVFYSVGT